MPLSVAPNSSGTLQAIEVLMWSHTYWGIISSGLIGFIFLFSSWSTLS